MLQDICGPWKLNDINIIQLDHANYLLVCRERENWQAYLYIYIDI